MPNRRILVIEDDAAIRRGVVDALRFAGFGTAEAGDAATGLAGALGSPWDLVLLDLVLPRGDGLAILRAVRDARPSMPVVILTARGSEDDRVAGLKIGADDYIVKPFSVREMLARVEAVLRRSVASRTDAAGRIPFAGGVADLSRREARFDDGGRCDLSERESELLRFLATNRGRAVTRDEILEAVWGLDPAGLTTRTIDMHVARLREKLRDDPARPRVLRTVRGLGYMLGDGEAER